MGNVQLHLQLGHSLAIGLAGLTLIAPAASARPYEEAFPSHQGGDPVTALVDAPKSPRASGAPAAVAYSKGTTQRITAPAATKIAPPRVESTDAGFDWGSVGVGAGAAGLVIVLGSLGAPSMGSRGRLRVAR